MPIRETSAEAQARLAREARLRRRQIGRTRRRLSALRARLRRVLDGIRRRQVPKPGLWHPHATRVPEEDAGSFATGFPARLVWHTTEGSSLPNYAGTAPHFTLDPKTGRLWQHIPVNRAARALMHPAGTVETNLAHAIQVELIGFAAETAKWPSAYYDRVAQLARWIEASTGVRRTCGVAFTMSVRHLSDGDWRTYSGHCGHQHVPSNDHHDPGAFRIHEVI